MSRRSALLSIFHAGVSAVKPDEAVMRHMRLDGDTLYVDEAAHTLAGKKILVLGAGKGAAPMAQALERLLGDRIDDGLVVVKYGHGLPLSRIRLMEGGHPVPDIHGMEGGQELLRLARSAGPDDVVIALFTGGASALTTVPAAGITLDELRMATTAMLACGATIHEINTIRKHLSSISGGLLAREAWPAEVITLLVSDVPGNTLDVIASGPTVPDESSYADCQEIVERYNLRDKFPSSIIERLKDGLNLCIPETPKSQDPVFLHTHTSLIATLEDALFAAADKAQALGFETQIMSPLLQGEARDKAREIVLQAQAELAILNKEKSHRPQCRLYGGETTVTLAGTGKGGRNQEMALAACLAGAGMKNIDMLFASTDGTDGPTDAAGGFADGYAIYNLDIAPEKSLTMGYESLKCNNSYNTLEKMGMLFKTGPTLTNVMDMAIVLLWPSK